MKKSLLIGISLIAVFFFTGINNVNAQWSLDVNYNQTNCNCGPLTGMVVDWEIRYTSDNSLFAAGSMGFVDNTGTVTIGGIQEIEPDAHDYFYVCARVSFYDPTLCCTGYNCDTYSSDQLFYGTSIGVTMN